MYTLKLQRNYKVWAGADCGPTLHQLALMSIIFFQAARQKQAICKALLQITVKDSVNRMETTAHTQVISQVTRKRAFPAAAVPGRRLVLGQLPRSSIHPHQGARGGPFPLRSSAGLAVQAHVSPPASARRKAARTQLLESSHARMYICLISDPVSDYSPI